MMVFIMREHILNECHSEKLHQYLVVLDLTSPSELRKKADRCVRTRVLGRTKGGWWVRGVTLRMVPLLEPKRKMEKNV